MIWTLRIDGWTPATVNELLYAHWGTAAKRKKLDRLTLQVALQNAHVPKARGRRKLTLTWVLGPRNKVKPDPDGVWKSLLDGLVHAGVLVDDHSDFVECAPVIFDRAPQKGIILTLEDV